MLRFSAALTFSLLVTQAWGAELGIASTFNDRRVSCAPFRIDPYRVMGAAHRTLPCGTRVEVTNRLNGRKAVARIIDLGPCSTRHCHRTNPRARKRIFDMLPMVARAIGSTGLTPVALVVR